MSRGPATASSSNADAAYVVVLGTFGHRTGAVKTVADHVAIQMIDGLSLSEGTPISGDQ
jgi:hypothetical protein